MGEFQSGQRGQTVNLLRFASMVRIRPPPPQKVQHHSVFDFLSLRTDSKGRSKQTVRWTVCPAVASPQRSESVCWITAAVRGRALPMRTDLKKCNRIRPPPSGFCEEPPWPGRSRANPSVGSLSQSMGAHCRCKPIRKHATQCFPSSLRTKNPKIS